MISFIFNSKNKYYFFSMLSVLLAAVMLYFGKNMPTAASTIPNLRELVYSEEYYLQYNDVSLDHYVLFHGLQDTLKNLTTAETLLLGSSRLGYAIQNNIIQGKKHEPYVMAFGHEEMDAFPMKIIQKFDLRPKLFIINVDKFFENKMSKFGAKVAKEGYFPAIRSFFEYRASTLAQNGLYEYLPYFAPFFTQREEVILVRSRKNGSWNFLKEPIEEQDFSMPEKSMPTEKQITYGKSVVEKLRARGSDVVFIVVPNPDTSVEWATEFSKALGVTFWSYNFEGVKSRDGSHVIQKDGEKYTEFLMEKLNNYYSAQTSSSL